MVFQHGTIIYYYFYNGLRRYIKQRRRTETIEYGQSRMLFYIDGRHSCLGTAREDEFNDENYGSCYMANWVSVVLQICGEAGVWSLVFTPRTPLSSLVTTDLVLFRVSEHRLYFRAGQRALCPLVTPVTLVYITMSLSQTSPHTPIFFWTLSLNLRSYCVPNNMVNTYRQVVFQKDTWAETHTLTV